MLKMQTDKERTKTTGSALKWKQQQTWKFQKTAISHNPLTGLLPVPTGSFSSSPGEGNSWNAQTFSMHSDHLPAFSARQAPWPYFRPLANLNHSFNQ